MSFSGTNLRQQYQDTYCRLTQYHPPIQVYIVRWNCRTINDCITRDVHRTHTPRGTSTGYSAATIDVTSLPIASNKCYRVYCVRVWPYPRCGSDRLPYIYNNVHIVKLKRWGQTLRIIGNSWKNSLNEAPWLQSGTHRAFFFAICYCLTPFRWFVRVYVAKVQFFWPDRQTTDWLTDRRLTDKTDCLTPLRACARGVIIANRPELCGTP